MRILMAGGGSGGHVTPALAILDQLVRQHSDLEVWFICDKKFAPQARELFKHAPIPVEVKIVAAGKLRRYYGVPLWKQLLDIPTVLLNIRDLFLIFIGFIQSLFLLLRFRPAVIFTKGGFVCLPVGIASHLLRKPLVIHDSDAHPGLTNRILARWATIIATGAPLENYNYPKSISHYVGIPIRSEFMPPSPQEQSEIKKQIMTDPQRSLLVVTGGGLGALRINEALQQCLEQLITGNVEIIHITGAGHDKRANDIADQQLGSDQRQLYHAYPFVDSQKMMNYLKAADVVVSRAGATTAAELAALHKPTIFIPNPMLTGGHQTKNAAAYGNAAVILDESKLEHTPQLLAEKVLEVINNPILASQLKKGIARFSKPNAATECARLILKAGEGRE